MRTLAQQPNNTRHGRQHGRKENADHRGEGCTEQSELENHHHLTTSMRRHSGTLIETFFAGICSEMPS